MTNLFRGTDSGANYQAEAVKAYLQMFDGIEESYSTEWKRHIAEPKIDRWYNCREQGYVITMRSKDYSRQINIAFFEHRNSDDIHALKWEQMTTNPPTIDNAQFGDVYKDKYDTSHRVGFGKASDMAEWVFEQLTQFWKETSL